MDCTVHNYFNGDPYMDRTVPELYFQTSENMLCSVFLEKVNIWVHALESHLSTYAEMDHTDHLGVQ